MPQSSSSAPVLRAYARTQASTASACLRRLSFCVYSHSNAQASSLDGKFGMVSSYQLKRRVGYRNLSAGGRVLNANVPVWYKKVLMKFHILPICRLNGEST